jgi:hypothetical protein
VLEERVKERMPERTVLEMLARTAYWIGWHRHFGPASGSDPKLAKALLRYVLTTFTYGSLMGGRRRRPGICEGSPRIWNTTGGGGRGGGRPC